MFTSLPVTLALHHQKQPTPSMHRLQLLFPAKVHDNDYPSFRLQNRPDVHHTQLADAS
jgi:hypothetical protein